MPHIPPCAAGLRWNPSTCSLHQHRPCRAMAEASTRTSHSWLLSIILSFWFSEEPWGMEVCCFYENHGATPTSQKQHHPQHRPGPSSSNQDLQVFFRISLKRPIPYLLSAIWQTQVIIHSSDYHLSSKSYNWRARSRMRCARLGNSLDGAVERGSWECFSCKTSYMFRCPDANLSRLESRLPQLSRLAT